MTMTTAMIGEHPHFTEPTNTLLSAVNVHDVHVESNTLTT